MDDVNQSTSENNIIVDRIEDFSDSPHDISKKAYSFRMGKGAQNWYASRLGFNIYLLREGDFTLVIEFFPPTMDQVTVSVVSSSAVEYLKSTNFNGNIDMKNHQIKNVQDGVENNDTVNINQLNEFEDHLVKFFRREMQTKLDPLNNKITELTTKVYAESEE